MTHSATSTIKGNIITAEKFYAEARKWAPIVRNQAKANTSIVLPKANRVIHTNQRRKQRKVRKNLATAFVLSLPAIVASMKASVLRFRYTAF